VICKKIKHKQSHDLSHLPDPDQYQYMKDIMKKIKKHGGELADVTE